MSKLYSFPGALALLAACWLALLLGASSLSGCAGTEQLLAPSRADTLLTAAGLASVHKLVVHGNVTIQQGTGNSVIGKDKTGQRAQALSTGANSPVTASTKKGALPWWVFLLVAVGGAIGWEYLSHQLNPLGWLPWRAKVS
ncbi:MAG: hypothetical protein ACRYFK_14285 [Janthinobacterium lividum]